QRWGETGRGHRHGQWLGHGTVGVHATDGAGRGHGEGRGLAGAVGAPAGLPAAALPLALAADAVLAGAARLEHGGAVRAAPRRALGAGAQEPAEEHGQLQQEAATIEHGSSSFRSDAVRTRRGYSTAVGTGARPVRRWSR